METTKYTFWELIKKYSIEIPIIQRDYAQGRIDEKATEIRDKLLKDIYSSLNNESALDFDFVYGSVKNTLFIPLDGQQRLTTLFLLHWYLAKRDDKTSSDLSQLLNFTYETRTSSREFCQGLIKSNIELSEEIQLSDLIKDCSWFFLSWEKDPTIKAMLVMLDSIEEVFKNTTGYFEKLTRNTNPIISFQFIPIENFGLTDNLYIKMNARGKALTDFENFKAKFEQFIDKKHSDLKSDFSSKIDGKWTDIFWKYKEEDVIDKPFVRYFYYISEMLYFFNKENNDTQSPFIYSNKNPKIKFDLIETVYKERQNVEFLFKSLDIIPDIVIASEKIFTSKYQSGCVTLYTSKTNLFNKCIEYSDFGIFEKILLFTIIQYHITIKNGNSEDNLSNLLRVVRNLLFKVRAQEQTIYRNYLRYEMLHVLLKEIFKNFIKEKNIYQVLTEVVFSTDITKGTRISGEDVYHEIFKAKLIIENPEIKELIHEFEDHEFLKGAIHNFNINNINEIVPIMPAFNDIWSTKDDSLITRSLLTIGDYSINITSCALGDTFLFGNGNNWNTILTNTSKKQDKIKEILTNYLLSYNQIDGANPKEKMNKMIEKWLTEEQEKDWRYYFIKYPEMTKGEINYFAWNNDFAIRNLGSVSFNPLVAYHINPYVRTVAKLIDNSEICRINHWVGRYSDETPLYLNNEINMYCEEEGWLIVIPDSIKLKEEIVNEYNLNAIGENNNKFLLKEKDDLDRIEIAVALAKRIYDK